MAVPSDTGLMRRYVAEEGEKSYFRLNTHTHKTKKQTANKPTKQTNTSNLEKAGLGVHKTIFTDLVGLGH